jgi:hypothetical protein
MTGCTASCFFGGNNQRRGVLFPSALVAMAASTADTARAQKRQDVLTDGVQTVKALDSNSDPRSLEDQPEVVPTEPSGATALFSRNSIAHTGPDASSDEISALLRESGAPDAYEVKTATPAKSPEQTNAARQAEQGATDAAPTGPRVDLTGIFRKVQVERVADGESHAEALFNEKSAGHRAEGVYTPMKSTEDTSQGFTQMFQSLSAVNGSASSTSPQNMIQESPAASAEKKCAPFEQRDEPLPRSAFSRDLHQHPGPPPLAQGEFTRLFQRLDREEQASARIDERFNALPATPQLGGGFTQLLRTLSAETESEGPAFPSAPAPLLPQSLNGPGEFTRIISGSMLREAQGRTGRPEADRPARSEEAQTPAPRTSVSVESNAAVTPGIVPPVPAAPSALMFAPGQSVTSTPPPIAAVPTSPQIAPPPASPAPAANKLQQYIPLLLIANLFLMLLVLILVAFVLLHR